MTFIRGSIVEVIGPSISGSKDACPHQDEIDDRNKETGGDGSNDPISGFSGSVLSCGVLSGVPKIVNSRGLNDGYNTERQAAKDSGKNGQNQIGVRLRPRRLLLGRLRLWLRRRISLLWFRRGPGRRWSWNRSTAIGAEFSVAFDRLSALSAKTCCHSCMI